MSVLTAEYFDGRNSLKHEVSVLIGGGRLKLVGRDVSVEFDARKVRVAPRLANTPRWMYLPGGGACAFSDNDAVDRFARERPFPRLLHRLESRPAFAALAVAMVVFAVWALIDRGLPPAVEYVAEKIPRGAESSLGEHTLAALDERWFRPSKLPPKRLATLHEKFARLTQAAGDTGPLRLEFRSSPIIGPNAFALPSGIIVVTDELVGLARNDDQVLAVLAHEIGHVRYRHTMRGLLQASATALIIAGVTGDIASTTSLAASAPALLLQTKYSRDYEREADAFAVDLLQRTGIGPQHFAAILARLEAKHGRRSALPSFLSSHPPTAEREALARAGTAPGREEEVEDEEPLSDPRPERPRVIVDPVQKQIASLLEKRDYAELERVLGDYQREFESDSKSSPQLEKAFGTFTKVPRSAEAALVAWVRASPSSYLARTARGAHYFARGLDARGTDVRSMTPKEDLSAMEAFFDRALEDLEISLHLSPKPYISRRYMMTVMLYTGSRDEFKANYDEALKLAPGSVETRLAYMRGLEPRWGGSYAQMEAFAAESRSALAPKDAGRLTARIHAHRGFESDRERDFKQALVHYDAAIALDPDAELICRRASSLSSLNRPGEAFVEVGRALAKTPDNRYCAEMAAYLAPRVDDPAEVVRVLSAVIDVDPSYVAAYNQRGWSYQREGKLDQAFPDYLAAAKLGDAWAQRQVGKLYWSGTGVKQDRQEAVAWLEKAAKQGNAEARADLDEARKAPGRASP